MTENFLHAVWQHHLYDATDLKTTDNQTIEVIHAGFPHQDAGPDFKQAIVKINDVLWAGDVEIHCNSSDWLKHKHQFDEKYKTVVLHVVYSYDADIQINSVENCPTLELKSRISQELMQHYDDLVAHEKILPCADQLPNFSPTTLTDWLAKLSQERLLRKQNDILSLLESCKGDWNALIFHLLAKNFGFKTNAPIFELLAKSLPYNFLMKHLHSRLQIYALIFGQAGMLEEAVSNTENPYYEALFSEYHYLKYKYQLIPLHQQQWNLLRLRPQNFPCMRLAQFSEVLYHFPNLFNALIINANDLIYSKLQDCLPHIYWETHYTFFKETKPHSCALSNTTINLIFINTIVPLLFSYSSFIGDPIFRQEAIKWLEKLPFEHNKLTRQYKEAGFPADSALCSQAILELEHAYCAPKKCISCRIGHQIITKNAEFEK